MNNGIEFLDNHQRRETARRLQRRADRKTTFRYWAALPVSAALAVTKPSWPTAILNGYLWDTDRTDGKDAKQARTLWSGLPRTKASEKDPSADKRLQYGNRLAIFTRAWVRGDRETAVVIAAETAVSAIRDTRMASHRSLAVEHDVETDAIDINRVKTALIAGGEVAALSPLAENQTARRAALAAICVGTLVGIVGAEQYGHQVRQEITSRD